MIKSTNSWSRFRQTVVIYQNFRSPQIFHLDWDFWDWKVVLIQNLDFLIIKTSFLKLLRCSWLSRHTFCQCQDQESRSRHNQDKLRLPRLLSVLVSVPVSSSSHCLRHPMLINLTKLLVCFPKILSNTI